MSYTSYKNLCTHQLYTTKDIIKLMELVNKQLQFKLNYDNHAIKDDHQVGLEYTKSGYLYAYIIYGSNERTGQQGTYGKQYADRNFLYSNDNVTWQKYIAYTLTPDNTLSEVATMQYAMPTNNEAYIDHVLVYSDYRKKGVGSSLMNVMLKDMADKGAQYVMLDCVDVNQLVGAAPGEIKSDADIMYRKNKFKDRNINEDNLTMPFYNSFYVHSMIRAIEKGEEFATNLDCPIKACLDIDSVSNK